MVDGANDALSIDVKASGGEVELESVDDPARWRLKMRPEIENEISSRR